MLGVLAMLAFLASMARGAEPPPPATGPKPDPWVNLTTHPEDPASVGVGRLVADVEFKTFDGSSHRISELLKDSKALVLCAHSVACPLCMRYAPRQRAIADEFTPRGVTFVMFNIEGADSETDMKASTRQLRWKHAYTSDRDQALRRELLPRTTTEVYVLDAARTLVYRGAVDDQFGVGTAKDAPEHEYLRAALEAVLNARPVETRAVWSPGCGVDPPKALDAPGPNDPQPQPERPLVTYYNQVARILNDRCVECHRYGGLAPFHLTGYGAVSSRAPMILNTIETGLMPPWGVKPPAPGAVSPWKHDLALPDRDREILTEWLSRKDHPAGDPKEAPLPGTYLNGWTLGAPDLLMLSPDVEVPPDGPMVLGSVVMLTRLERDAWVKSVEVLPRTRKAVHHTMLYLLPPPPLGRAALAEPGEPATDLIGTFGPAFSAVSFPENAGLFVPAGSAILAKVYSRPFGDLMKENIRVSFRFHKDPPPMEIRMTAVQIKDIRIPSNTPSFSASAELTLDQDLTVTALIPALRSHAKQARFEATAPSPEGAVADADAPGVSELLNVWRYDYRWRTRYALREPMVLKKGTKLTFACDFDNSANNPNNSNPAHEVRWGWDPSDEMPMGYVEYVVAREGAKGP